MKKNVTVFVSYARANRDLATRFLKKFKEQAAPSKQYHYTFWRDNDILVGEKWHEEIQYALGECDVGLVLLSPAFLGSQYIQNNELPNFVKSGRKSLIPVMLQPIDLERHDLKGLQQTHIFRLDRPRFASPKAYGECSGAHRDQFALEVFRQVEARLDKVARK
ncbi:MAG: toll/interleukin-1 receptor domain-containing protein [Nitrospirales bacterium]|nr:toll/interleukin-1 receptor domain-containing protein [Nitrospira sp.]MDR4459556.1 toll/interleukin-1 receptor domain-containing protein [Nitrospirales bacterium]